MMPLKLYGLKPSCTVLSLPFSHKPHKVSTKLLHEYLICTAAVQLSLLHADHPCSSSSIQRATLHPHCCQVVCVLLTITQDLSLPSPEARQNFIVTDTPPQVFLQDPPPSSVCVYRARVWGVGWEAVPWGGGCSGRGSVLD